MIKNNMVMAKILAPTGGDCGRETRRGDDGGIWDETEG
jgi:hypothetical protein